MSAIFAADSLKKTGFLCSVSMSNIGYYMVNFSQFDDGEYSQFYPGLSLGYFREDTDGIQSGLGFHYTIGVKQGVYSKYYRNGKIQETCNYVNGYKDGLAVWYFDNEVIIFKEPNKMTSGSGAFNISSSIIPEHYETVLLEYG